MRLTKLDAAADQLVTAVRLLFARQSPLSVRTLIGAASTVLADLVDAKTPGASWRSRLSEDARGLGIEEPYEILNRVSNFLKHANRDPQAVLEFEEEENDDALFFATLECGEVGSVPHDLQVFQVWYMASYPKKFDPSSELVRVALGAYPDLEKLNRSARLVRGAAMSFALPSAK